MIFGSGSAQFQQSGSSVVTLQHSTIIPEYIIPDEIEHKSILNGHKNYITLGDYSNFKVGLNLHKYANPKDKFQEIYQYLHKDVWFWPHSDGYAISGSDNVPVQFHIKNIEISYLENLHFKDYLMIEFDSIDYTVVSKSMV